MLGGEITVGLVGYGRFGVALGTIIQRRGFNLRVYDPIVSQGVVDALRVNSLEELSTQCKYLILAVPVVQISSALDAMKPHLTAEHLVMDVGSVKVRPIETMGMVLGAEIPWVGTHPLFGPNSLASGDQPIRVVICPNDLHPVALVKARAFFEQLGCEILEQDAAEHDRVMAETHALACFVAQGMIESSMTRAFPFVPPSFEAMAKMIDAVRSEAAHLLSAIATQNPFAASARLRLMDSLKSLNNQFIEQAQPNEASLIEIRRSIDAVDRQLVSLLGRRADLAKQVAAVKVRDGQEILDSSREAEVLRERREWCSQLGLDPEAIENIFKTVMHFSKDIQEVYFHSLAEMKHRTENL